MRDGERMRERGRGTYTRISVEIHIHIHTRAPAHTVHDDESTLALVEDISNNSLRRQRPYKDGAKPNRRRDQEESAGQRRRNAKEGRHTSERQGEKRL